MTKEPPPIGCERLHVTLTVADLRAAIEHYTTRLGFELAFTWPPDTEPDFAGVDLGLVQIFLHQGSPNPAGITLHFVVDDADALYERQRGNGAVVDWEPMDRAWGLRDYQVRDLDGYALRFAHYIVAAPDGG